MCLVQCCTFQGRLKELTKYSAKTLKPVTGSCLHMSWCFLSPLQFHICNWQQIVLHQHPHGFLLQLPWRKTVKVFSGWGNSTLAGCSMCFVYCFFNEKSWSVSGREIKIQGSHPSKLPSSLHCGVKCLPVFPLSLVSWILYLFLHKPAYSCY